MQKRDGTQRLFGISKIPRNLLIWLFMLSIASISLTFPSFASPFTVVADLDDTIKITNVSSHWHAFMNGVFHKETFLGMKELLEEMNCSSRAKPFDQPTSYCRELIYLSGSPQMLLKSARHNLLYLNDFPEGQFIFSDWFQWEDVRVFKSREIRKLAEANQESAFVFLGDDTQYDPEIFDQFLKSETGENRTLQIYVHQVKGRQLPQSSFPYNTAFEVALNEVEARRFRPEQAIRIGNAVLGEGTPDHLFPDYVVCPRDRELKLGPIGSADPDLVKFTETFTHYIRWVCSLRK